MTFIWFLNILFNRITFCGLLFFLLFIDNACLQSNNRDVETTPTSISDLKEVSGSPVSANEVHFFLHTLGPRGHHSKSINPSKPYEIVRDDFKIYFLIHGWTQSRENTPWFKPLTEFLLENDEDSYVIQTDWRKPAAVNYSLSAFYTESVGNIMGDFINRLVTQNRIPKKNIVLIGHSLGAHVAGFIGKRYYDLTRKRIPRIIALDPAGPLFSKRSDKLRLNRYDAEVVMVIHTNGNGFGIARPCGTIDFFPNGGRHQPGCATDISRKLTDSSDSSIWCDHTRAYNLFLEALKYPKLFIAKKCKNYDAFQKFQCQRIEVSLGDIETTEEGLFYLKTGGIPPFLFK